MEAVVPAINDLLDARNEALRKIGRNVVNFQKMEAMLKWLNSQSMMTGLTSDIADIRARMVKSVASQPMGRLADTFIKTAYSAKSKESDPSTTAEEVSVSFSFRIEATPELARERKRALSSVVAERNKLIHQWLATFDPGSVASCQELAAMLDQQDARIQPEYEILRSMVSALTELKEEMRRFLASDEFLTDL